MLCCTALRENWRRCGRLAFAVVSIALPSMGNQCGTADHDGVGVCARLERRGDGLIWERNKELKLKLK
jgi:hypothetical protein